MASRLDLHAVLIGLLPGDEPELRVYFQRPTDNEMKYPCIVYERSDIVPGFADNIPYWVRKQYQITVIDRDPDSLIPDKVAALESSMFDRPFVVDNLNHSVFKLYF